MAFSFSVVIVELHLLHPDGIELRFFHYRTAAGAFLVRPAERGAHSPYVTERSSRQSSAGGLPSAAPASMFIHVRVLIMRPAYSLP